MAVSSVLESKQLCILTRANLKRFESEGLINSRYDILLNAPDVNILDNGNVR